MSKSSAILIKSGRKSLLSESIQSEKPSSAKMNMDKYSVPPPALIPSVNSARIAAAEKTASKSAELCGSFRRIARRTSYKTASAAPVSRDAQSLHSCSDTVTPISAEQPREEAAGLHGLLISQLAYRALDLEFSHVKAYLPYMQSAAVHV